MTRRRVEECKGRRMGCCGVPQGPSAGVGPHVETQSSSCGGVWHSRAGGGVSGSWYGMSGGHGGDDGVKHLSPIEVDDGSRYRGPLADRRWAELSHQQQTSCQMYPTLSRDERIDWRRMKRKVDGQEWLMEILPAQLRSIATSDVIRSTFPK